MTDLHHKIGEGVMLVLREHWFVQLVRRDEAGDRQVLQLPTRLCQSGRRRSPPCEQWFVSTRMPLLGAGVRLMWSGDVNEQP